ncbi:MAG: dTMP kinase [Phycisphaerales bacterium]|jgi:dTMP kinase
MHNPQDRGQDSGLPPGLAEALAGKFIVFEGPDGSGKSTQLTRFLAACRDAGLNPAEVREPGGTEVGERIREALLTHLDHEEMSIRCEMLLYMASRAQLCEQKIMPALKDGRLVVADRFVSSTLAYQGAGGGLPEEDILDAARIATKDLKPDAVVIFDVDEHTAAGRMNPLLRGDDLDRMEAKGAEFHRKVRAGYLHQIESAPHRCLRVDGTGCESTVWSDLLSVLTKRFVS